ncbi:unnamed protein product [Lupinus luteus]|uniref:Uncharacterized protein n=1 Tax=Lupinus luteus TaxID=3873 RepID=A0AAV1XN26_LUPLU
MDMVLHGNQPERDGEAVGDSRPSRPGTIVSETKHGRSVPRHCETQTADPATTAKKSSSPRHPSPSPPSKPRLGEERVTAAIKRSSHRLYSTRPLPPGQFGLSTPSKDEGDSSWGWSLIQPQILDVF